MSSARILILLTFASVPGACIGPGLGQRQAIPQSQTAQRAQGEINQHIVVCGESYDIGSPVVLWMDEGGYDATSTSLHFLPAPASAKTPTAGELRYQAGRVGRSSGETLVYPGDPLSLLSETVDQFVLHYDVCGTSRRCFKVLHDRRGLSVHFLLDLDGTIYQTMDLVHTGWHAAKANTRSIGIEIANMGAYRVGKDSPLDHWYRQGDAGTQIVLPPERGDGGLRLPDAVLAPRRPERVRGNIQGGELEMYDLTKQQYVALTALTAKLCELFPRIQADAPRDSQGEVSSVALSEEEWQEFHGILGHYHVTTRKTDPGPAFDWEFYLAGVRHLLRPKP